MYHVYIIMIIIFYRAARPAQFLVVMVMVSAGTKIWRNSTVMHCHSASTTVQVLHVDLGVHGATKKERCAANSAAHIRAYS